MSNDAFLCHEHHDEEEIQVVADLTWHALNANSNGMLRFLKLP